MFSTGLAKLDEIIHGLRTGDNVVWQIEDIEDYFDFGPFRYHVTPRRKIHVYNFYNFSYLPFNGILNNRLFKTEIYFHKPVAKFINFLLETPNLMYLVFWIFLLFIMSIKPILKWMKKSIRFRDGSLRK